MIKFGTDGWRAKIAEDFTFENVGKVSVAFAKFLKARFKNPEVVVGYDARFLSEDFAEFSARTMAEEGVKVFLSDRITPTPAVSFFIAKEKLSGGVAITASHNPYFFNGFKVREWFGGPASPKTTEEIEKIIQEINWDEHKKHVEKKRKEGSTFKHNKTGNINAHIHKEDILSPYIEAVKVDSDITKFLRRIDKVVFDVMHGACAGLPTKVLGKKAIEVRAERNPLFPPYGRPEPTPYTLSPLQKKCREVKADGFAFDGDGDRIYACTKSGRIIDAHKIFAILVEHIAKHRGQKGKVYKTVTATDLVDKVAEFWGLEVVTTPVGFKYIMQGMVEDNAIIGGEESGGIGMSYHLRERDSLFCACVLLTHSVIEGKDFAGLVRDIERRFGKHRYVRRDYHVPDNIKSHAVEKAGEIDRIGNFKVEKIEKIDGVKLRFKEGGFLLVRPSGTEPVLRIYAETNSEEKSDMLIKKFCKIVGIS